MTPENAVSPIAQPAGLTPGNAELLLAVDAGHLDDSRSDNGPLSRLRTARRPCGSRWTNLVDVGVRPRLVAASVTGVGSWIGRWCREDVHNGLPTLWSRPVGPTGSDRIHPHHLGRDR